MDECDWENGPIDVDGTGDLSRAGQRGSEGRKEAVADAPSPPSLSYSLPSSSLSVVKEQKSSRAGTGRPAAAHSVADGKLLPNLAKYDIKP